jgi:hypothetical protein
LLNPIPGSHQQALYSQGGCTLAPWQLLEGVLYAANPCLSSVGLTLAGAPLIEQPPQAAPHLPLPSSHEQVAADSKFVDLGADSLDTVEIMMAL